MIAAGATHGVASPDGLRRFCSTRAALITGGVERMGQEIEIQIGRARLGGALALPLEAAGCVIFAHGSGSSRFSPRNALVARRLGAAGLGTLLFDLLTEEEAARRANVFDVPLLTERLLEATRWLRGRPETGKLRLGYFGASTGAAAALAAAAQLGPAIDAVVSRGGRPDLAEPATLAKVEAPTLLIVGGRDEVVLELNRSAQAHLRCDSALEVVPGATHLFEEPGALEHVAELATRWFLSRMSPRAEDRA